MKNEILKCLKETDGYVSGQELCERLGVSRTAVWKVIRQLEAEGYTEIEEIFADRLATVYMTARIS